MNNTDKKATIVKLKDNTYTARKQPRSNHIKFDNFFKKHNHRELAEYLISKTIKYLFFLYVY